MDSLQLWLPFWHQFWLEPYGSFARLTGLISRLVGLPEPRFALPAECHLCVRPLCNKSWSQIWSQLVTIFYLLTTVEASLSRTIPPSQISSKASMTTSNDSKSVRFSTFFLRDEKGLTLTQLETQTPTCQNILCLQLPRNSRLSLQLYPKARKVNLFSHLT